MTDAKMMERNEVLRARLAVLRVEHRDLDEAIRAMEDRASMDMLALRRMKKRKLMLKDQIARIEDEITPDIIA